MRSVIVAGLAALASVTSALNPIVVQEQEFIDTSTNERFVVLGIDYQTTYGGAAANYDPLTDASYCLRDAALLQSLGVNTIRVYQVVPGLNHDECMSIFNAVGIYLLLDVNSGLPGQSLDRSAPWTTYDVDYLTHIFTVVEAFKDYPNLLGFFSGNEIINDVPTGKANPPYIRAVQRDLKNYIAAHASRAIPVGYSAAQVQSILQDTWAYLQCNNSVSGADLSRSDFFGLNSYSWCGSDSSFTTSGYDVLVEMFGNTTIPVFFSEYGCNVPLPRYFDEVPVLYGPQMTTLSGGLVYEWQQAVNDFGLLNQNGNGSASLLPDYYTLASQYAKLDINLIESSNSTATNLQPPACNPSLISESTFSNNFAIPNPPPGAEQLISAGVANPPTGAIVAVTQTSVAVAVYATDGSLITGLAITPVSAANHPGTTGLASGIAAGGATSAAGSETSAAGSGTMATESSTPAAGSPTPAAGNGTPAAESTTPAAGNGTPAASSATPTGGNGTPAAGSTTPTAGSDTPAAGSATPAAGSDTPAAGSATPAAGSGTTAAGSDTSAAGSATPAAGSDTSAAGSETPVSSSASPSSTKKSSAQRVEVGAVGGALAALVLGVLAL